MAVPVQPGAMNRNNDCSHPFVPREARTARLDETPLGKYLKVQRKTREKRRKLVEKAREGEDEILEED